MELKTEKIGDVTLVVVQTEVLDAANSEEFKASIAPVLDESRKVVFDMSLVRFIDSSGCGVLLSCLRRLNSLGGDLKLYGIQETVRKLFELVRMYRIIEIYNTKEDAVGSF